jgi:hypothetical protein
MRVLPGTKPWWFPIVGGNKAARAFLLLAIYNAKLPEL